MKTITTTTVGPLFGMVLEEKELGDTHPNLHQGMSIDHRDNNLGQMMNIEAMLRWCGTHVPKAGDIALSRAMTPPGAHSGAAKITGLPIE